MAPPYKDDSPTGSGEAAGGLVRAVVGEDGLLAELRLNARAMRFSSKDLAEHVLAAVRAAQQDRLSRAEPPAEEESLDEEELIRRLDDLELQAARDFAQLTASLDEALRRIEER
ncbi:hypothetical protein [Nonomuraea sp. NPDC002799]